MKNVTFLMISLCVFLVACDKEICQEDRNDKMHYYEVVFRNSGQLNGGEDWRDTSFVVATSDPQLISAVNAQLGLFVNDKKQVTGTLVRGNGGYNKNSTHDFKWRFKEDDWQLTDLSIEIYDGRPYNDVDLNLDYWMDTMKRYSPWSSYIKREIKK